MLRLTEFNAVNRRVKPYVWGAGTGVAKSDFYKRLRLAVASAEIDWSELARRVGSKPSTVSGWKTGKSLPEGEYMLKLPDALGVSAEWLITGRGDMHANATEAQTKMRLIRAILETPLTELAEDGRAWVNEELQHYDRQPPAPAPPRRAGGGGGPS